MRRATILHRLLPTALLALALLIPALRAASASSSPNFYLKAGDSVCFYGDSITEQRFYGVDVQTYVRTRFPGLRVKFVNAGVGGDRVSGGWAGGVDLRLARDVFPFKPNVVTIMLGMNDARYRAFDQKIFDEYAAGYRHLIDSLQQHLPGVRIVLLEPTPYDDVTVPVKFPGGYNAVLLRYCAFVRQLAAERGLMCVDLNTPLVRVMEAAQAQDPKLAGEVIPGRVHPSPVGELVMAQALLEAWHAPSTVTAVTIDAPTRRVVQADRTTVSGLSRAPDGALSWTQADESLPFPILGLREKWPQFPPAMNPKHGLTFFWPAPAPDWSFTDPAAAMIVRLSGFRAALDHEPLKVTGLPAGNYALKINGRDIGQFTAAELAAGIELSSRDTPMQAQAYDVLAQVWKQVQWRFYAWRGIQTQLHFNQDQAVQHAAAALVAALEAQRQEIEEQQYAMARPRPAHYTLTPVAAP